MKQFVYSNCVVAVRFEMPSELLSVCGNSDWALGSTHHFSCLFAKLWSEIEVNRIMIGRPRWLHVEYRGLEQHDGHKEADETKEETFVALVWHH